MPTMKYTRRARIAHSAFIQKRVFGAEWGNYHGAEVVSIIGISIGIGIKIRTGCPNLHPFNGVGIIGKAKPRIKRIFTAKASHRRGAVAVLCIGGFGSISAESLLLGLRGIATHGEGIRHASRDCDECR